MRILLRPIIDAAPVGRKACIVYYGKHC